MQSERNNMENDSIQCKMEMADECFQRVRREACLMSSKKYKNTSAHTIKASMSD